jgi:hypothetical protein
MAQLEELEPVEPNPPRWVELGAVVAAPVVELLLPRLTEDPLLPPPPPRPLPVLVACCSQFGVPGGQAVAAGR